MELRVQRSRANSGSMTMCPRRPSLTGMVIVVCVSAGTYAQWQPAVPNMIVSGQDNCTRVLLRVISPAPGSSPTVGVLATLPQPGPGGCGSSNLGISARFLDVNYRDLYVATSEGGLSPTRFWRMSPSGAVGAASLPVGLWPHFVDENANYVAATFQGVAWVRYDGTVVRTILDQSIWFPTVVVEDVDTVDIVLFDSTYFRRVSRSGVVSGPVWPTLPGGHPLSIAFDPETGSIVSLQHIQYGPLPSQYYLGILRLNRDGVNWAQLWRPAQDAKDFALDRDGTLWLVGGVSLHHTSVSGSSMGTWSLPYLTLTFSGIEGWHDVFIEGQNNLRGVGTAQVGSRYHLFLSAPNEGNLPYQVAASLALRPGIDTGYHKIHLSPDGLFAASLSNATFFQGFSGVLDSSGSARASIEIHQIPSLQGARIYLTFVTLHSGSPDGISAVSNVLGVSVQ